jgi:hypothetical protein
MIESLLIGLAFYAAGIATATIAALLYRRRLRRALIELEQVAVLLRPQAD